MNYPERLAHGMSLTQVYMTDLEYLNVSRSNPIVPTLKQ